MVSIGTKQLLQISNHSGPGVPQLRVSNTANRFIFYNKINECIGKAELHLHTSIDAPPVQLRLNIVQADVSALLGLDVLDGESIVADTVANRLTKRVKVGGDEKNYH